MEEVQYNPNKDGNTLILTVGLAGSGKSTWARNQEHVVVSPDAVRLAMHGQPFISQAEDLVWATVKLMVKHHFIYNPGTTVILDATNITQAQRDEWISSDWDLLFAVFDTPFDVCMERRMKTNFPPEILHQMHDVLDLPDRSGIQIVHWEPPA